jgi:hypothetical protein
MGRPESLKCLFKRASKACKSAALVSGTAGSAVFTAAAAGAAAFAGKT